MSLFTGYIGELFCWKHVFTFGFQTAYRICVLPFVPWLMGSSTKPELGPPRKKLGIVQQNWLCKSFCPHWKVAVIMVHKVSWVILCNYNIYNGFTVAGWLMSVFLFQSFHLWKSKHTCLTFAPPGQSPVSTFSKHPVIFCEHLITLIRILPSPYLLWVIKLALMRMFACDWSWLKMLC